MLTPNVPDRQHVIPAGLAHHKRFIFSDEQKRPCDFNGVPCDPHDPAKQLTIEQLKSSPCWTNFYYGIGIVLHEDDGLFCVDPDKCIDEHGNLSPLAHEMLARFPGAYVETSVSGRGLHIFGRARVADHHTRAPGFEAYSRRRYIRLTGTLLPGHTRGDPNLNFTGAFSQLLTDYRLWHTAALEPAPVVSGYDGPRLDLGATGGQYSNDELIRIMLDVSGSGAAAFGDAAHPRDLWNADAVALARHYPQEGRGYDWTRAAAALVYHLMFFTGGHESRTLELFRLSGLYRDEDDIRKLALPVGRAGTTLTRVYHVPRPGMVLPPAPGAVGRVIPIVEFSMQGEDALPPRDFLYGKHYIRRETSATVAPPGTGKTALAFVEIFAMLTGRRLLRDFSKQPLSIIYFGEDDINEIYRRLYATLKHFKIDPMEYSGRLAVYSMRDYVIKFAVRDKGGFNINRVDIEAIKTLIRARRADIAFFDTMTKIHSANENDNGDMDALINELNKIASECNCAIELLAHTRKSSFGNAVDSIEQARGASAIIGAVRSARLIMRMSGNEGNEFGISDDEQWQYIRFGDAKTNQATPPNKSHWMRLINVTLANGDDVQTIVPFERSAALNDDIFMPNESQIVSIINEIELGLNREDDGAKHWAGKAVSKVTGLSIDKHMVSDRERRKNIKTIKHIISKLVETKRIEEAWGYENRNKCKIYRHVINGKTVDF